MIDIEKRKQGEFIHLWTKMYFYTLKVEIPKDRMVSISTGDPKFARRRLAKLTGTIQKNDPVLMYHPDGQANTINQVIHAAISGPGWEFEVW